jgi:tRNA/rRNA methyltransferase
MLQIPTHGNHPSLNLAQAVVVVLYELSRTAAAEADTSHRAHTEADSADMETLNRLLETMRDALTTSGYAAPQLQPSFEEKLRRLVRAMRLSRADAETWTGIFRQVLWKLNRRD